MKKPLFLSIALFFSFIGVYATNYICSNTTQTGDTIQFVYCAEDYHPIYNPAGYLIEDPVMFFIDLGQTAIYSISGHVELTSLDNVDFVKIYKANADTSFASLYGTYQGIQDIQIYTQETRYIAIEVYCYNGAVSSTSGLSLIIRPTNQTIVEQILVSDKVGIGTTTPTASLDVVGDVKINNNNYYLSVTLGPRNVHFNTNAIEYDFNKPVLSQGFASSKNADLVLSTYNTPRVTIDDTTGYVGIGTTSPKASLHVNGNIRGNGTLGALTIETESGTTTIGAQGWSYSHFHTSLPRFYFYKPIVVGNGEFSSGSSSDLKLQTFHTTRLTIKNQTGYVGIGKDNPTAKLDVEGNIQASDSIFGSTINVQQANIQNALYCPTLSTNNLHVSDNIRVSDSIIGSVIQVQTANVLTSLSCPNLSTTNILVTGNLQVYDSIQGSVINAQRANISQFSCTGLTGNELNTYSIYGRGNTLTIYAPTLNCSGKIRANEIVVNTSGADFVFDKSYDLRPLDEVNAYIQEHQHLPEVPSAKQMQEEGMSMNQMVVKLLQKVEELTLYTIQQEERIKELEKMQR